MVSKNIIILFFFLVFSCSGMVEGLKCHHRSKQGNTVLVEKEKNCDELCLEWDQVGAPKYLSNYFARCETMAGIKADALATDKLGFTEKEYDNLEWKKVEGEGNQKCTIMKNTAQARIYCVCASDNCNKVGSKLHDLFVQEFKSTHGSDLYQLLSGFPTTTTSTTSTTSIETNPTTTESAVTTTRTTIAGPKSSETATVKDKTQTGDSQVSEDGGNGGAGIKTGDSPVSEVGGNGGAEIKTGDSQVSEVGGSGGAGIKPIMSIMSFVMIICNIIFI